MYEFEGAITLTLTDDRPPIEVALVNFQATQQYWLGLGPSVR